MNYEEKYNEALERARKNKARLNGVPIEEVLPELAESEDERIRKELVAFFKEMRDTWHEIYWHDLQVEGILAYLEKQKEQKEELVYRLNGLMQDYIKEGKDDEEKEHRLKCYQLFWDALEDTNFFEQKEQKPELPKPHKGDDTNPYDMSVSEAQEYAIKRGFGVPFNDGEVYVDERHITQTIGNILRWADEHPKEQKPWKVGANAYFTPEQKPAEIPPYVTGVKGHPDPAGKSNLEEAAEKYIQGSMCDLDDGPTVGLAKDAFIAGAEWQKEQELAEMAQSKSPLSVAYANRCFENGKQAMKEQMMKEAVEGFIFQSEDYYPKELVAQYNGELKHGDKVKIIIVKEDDKG